MEKGLAEATDMVGGALFDQCKSDVGTVSVGPQNRFTASILERLPSATAV